MTSTALRSARLDVPSVWLARPHEAIYADGTEIQWTWDYLASSSERTLVRREFTFNPWWGCTKVSAACDHCYAEATAHAKHASELIWGNRAARRFFGEDHWLGLKRLNARALRDEIPIKVFVASMSDHLEILHRGHKDRATMEETRMRLHDEMIRRGALRFLSLTKRPQNVERLVPSCLLAADSNLWIGITTEDQVEFDKRWPYVQDLPNILFLSVEPMLGPIKLPQSFLDVGKRVWVIAGGESGPLDRVRNYCLEDWRYLRDQCVEAGIPVFHKQYGDRPTFSGNEFRVGKHGKDTTRWFEEDRIRQFPA